MPETSLLSIAKEGGYWLVARSVLAEPSEASRRTKTLLGAGTVIVRETAEVYLRRGIHQVDAIRYRVRPDEATIAKVIASAEGSLSAAVRDTAGGNIRGVRQGKRLTYKFLLGRFIAAVQTRLLPAVGRALSQPDELRRIAGTLASSDLLATSDIESASSLAFLLDLVRSDTHAIEEAIIRAILAVAVHEEGPRAGRQAIAHHYKSEAAVTSLLLEECARHASPAAVLSILKDTSSLGKVRRYRPGKDDLAAHLQEIYRGTRASRAGEAEIFTAIGKFLGWLQRTPRETLLADPEAIATKHDAELRRILDDHGHRISAALVLTELFTDLEFLRSRNEAAPMARYIYWGIEHRPDRGSPADVEVPIEARKVSLVRELRARLAAGPLAGEGAVVDGGAALAAIRSLRDETDLDVFLDFLRRHTRAGSRTEPLPAGLPGPLRQAVDTYLKTPAVQVETSIFDALVDRMRSLRVAMQNPTPPVVLARLRDLVRAGGAMTPQYGRVADRLGWPMTPEVWLADLRALLTSMDPRRVPDALLLAAAERAVARFREHLRTQRGAETIEAVSDPLDGLLAEALGCLRDRTSEMTN